MAKAIAALSSMGDVRVLKISDGENRTYDNGANESSNVNSSSTTNIMRRTYIVWEWEVTFVCNGANRYMPLMTAVWAGGWTQPRLIEEHKGSDRSARLICDSCEAFPNGSWPSEAEKAVGPRIQVIWRHKSFIAASHHRSYFIE